MGRQTSPRIDYGEINANALGPPIPFEVELVDGRLISLRELHRYSVYAGALCGVPPTPEDGDNYSDARGYAQACSNLSSLATFFTSL